jgi:YD repeat-containing protein
VAFNCVTGASSVSLISTDHLEVWVSYTIQTVPGNKSVKVELGIETGLDSQISMPTPIPPTLTNLSPTSGPVNWPVTLTGTQFGASQGSSTVTFNGTAATPTSWGNTSIAVSVPAGATTGPVVVNVGGTPTNGLAFTVIPPPTLSSVAPTAAHVADVVTITGVNFLASQGSSTVTFNGVSATPTSWNNTTIVTPVPAGATSGNILVTVSGQATNPGLPFTVIVPGSIGGTVTRTADGTPLSGATVQAVLVGAIKGTATTAADGTYTIASLDPASYDVRLHATGFSSELRQAIAVTSSTVTSVNVGMSVPGGVAGKITQADGTTPIAGAAVTVYSGSFQKGSAATNAAGDYVVGALRPGAYTVQAANVGNRTKEQAATVAENATATANMSLDPAGTAPVLYAYDAVGRLIQVTDRSGDSAIYRYDAVGNMTSLERPGATVVSISGFSPASGAVGGTVTVYGTGFSTTAAQNTVTFSCGTSCTVNATVSSATSTQIVVAVPATAASDAIGVTAPGGSASSAPRTFTVNATGAAPTIAGFTPTLVAPGDSLTVTGTNFDTTPINDRLSTNVALAQVSSASATTLQATVPVTTTGRVSVATQNGTATSTDYLWVAPPPYAVPDVLSTGVIAFANATNIAINTGGKIAIRAFDGTQGHRASVSVTGANFAAGGTVAIYGPFGNRIATGFTGSGFLDPVDLMSTATYTLLFAPNGLHKGSATVTVFDVPPDVTDPIPLSPANVVAALTTPGRNARLPFSATANDRVSVTTSADTNLGGLLQVRRPDGTILRSVMVVPGYPGFLDAELLPSSGTYSVVVDPSTTNTGTTTVTRYNVVDTSGTVTLNGPAVAVPLGTPGQNGTLTFSGTQGQQVTVHVTGNTIGSVTVKLVSNDGVTVLSQALTSGDFNLTPATLPATATNYTIVIDPLSAGTGTLNISITN